MSLRSVNLNLIPILRALLRERNLSRAARSLGLSQPAVSAALARLRVILGDPLLIREGRGMTLSLRAYELIEKVEQICESLEDVVGSDRFDPTSSRRRFVIASADYAVVTVAPQLIRALSTRAPNATIHMVDVPHQMLEPNAGEVDFFLVPDAVFRVGPRADLRSTVLIQDELVTVVGTDHPLARIPAPSRAQLLAERYVAYYPALTAFDAIQLSTLADQSSQGRHVVARIQQFSLLPALAFETGCAALVPRRIAEYVCQNLPARIIDDGALPIQFDLALAWYTANENEPAHRWFRELIVSECAQMREG